MLKLSNSSMARGGRAPTRKRTARAVLEASFVAAMEGVVRAVQDEVATCGAPAGVVDDDAVEEAIEDWLHGSLFYQFGFRSGRPGAMRDLAMVLAKHASNVEGFAAMIANSKQRTRYSRDAEREARAAATRPIAAKRVRRPTSKRSNRRPVAGGAS